MDDEVEICWLLPTITRRVSVDNSIIPQPREFYVIVFYQLDRVALSTPPSTLDVNLRVPFNTTGRRVVYEVLIRRLPMDQYSHVEGPEFSNKKVTHQRKATMPVKASLHVSQLGIE
ncbi:hypothetical protein RF11_08869 [Thelohanellus kitauei]|uniref:Uncharacterized protein n=1 Tax=Thelohanellus kitauei TaxID=669202 RepID=A0A0C2NHV2_THEKT|nr:hypothetical protein RF11_08869 [Thelohanellus kitauei]